MQRGAAANERRAVDAGTARQFAIGRHRPGTTEAEWLGGIERMRVKNAITKFSLALVACLCSSGCLIQIEHNATSPGARGVVLDADSRAPLSGAEVVISRLWDIPLPSVADALTNTRPPVVVTGKRGRFCIRPEWHWDVIGPLVERFREPGGTLIVQRAGYEPAAVLLDPVSMQRTNLIEVRLRPVAQ